MAKCLVTGGAGFIGSNLVDELIKRNHEVIVIDNESAESNAQFYWNKNAKNYKYSIIEYQNIRPLFDGIDYVFHLAAESRIQPAILNPIHAVMINSVGTCTVLQCAREANVKRVIYSSTSSGYGLNPFPNVETQSDDCLNPYSVSKVNGEKLCNMYTRLFGLKTISLRYFNVYGDRQPIRGQYAPLVGIFLRQKFNNEPLTIVGDGEQRRDFTNVADAVNANILAATVYVPDEYFGQVYNIGTGNNYSINQIAAMISNYVTHIPERIGEARTTLCDNTKFSSIFGWKPIIRIEDYLKAAIKE